MTAHTTQRSRRAFFLQGGAVLGAGVASTVGAAALTPANAKAPDEHSKNLQQQLNDFANREAIRQLHLTFTSRLEHQAYEHLPDLFDEHAHVQLSGVAAAGKPAIARLFAEQYRNQQAPVMHGAYRPNALQQNDALTLNESGSHASATYHVDVQVNTPLQGDCTAAQMARLQGQMADCRWESGRLEASYVKTRGEWKIASLRYLPS
ncbi:MAG: nuclear transport factor 2 family protein [Steroidobacteraceae bacterium]|nr:nuclear transport factor 2 family protein [Steroidobacteraceae bacterium]